MLIDNQASYVRFVCPFTFDPDEFIPLSSRANQSSWSYEGKGHTIWKASRFPEEDLLPHVAHFLNATGSNNSYSKDATAFLWQLENEALTSTNWGIGSQANWHIKIGDAQDIKFHWNLVELALFRLGTGLLTFEIVVDSPDPAQWLDFIHSFRFYEGQRSPRLFASRKVGPHEWVPFTQEAQGRSTDLLDADSNKMSATIRKVLMTFADTASPKKKWWQEIFVPGRLMPFVCLVNRTEPEEAQSSAEYFYRVRNFFSSTQEISPSKFDLEESPHNTVPYAERQWFFFVLEGAGYISFGPPNNEFFLRTLPDHIRKQYFLLYILSLNQRFTLIRLQSDIAAKWVGPSRLTRASIFKKIYEQLLTYEARDYFPQAMQRDHHHSCYRKCQEVFQISQMHDELRDEVQRMFERASIERDDHLQKKLDLLTFLVGFPILIFSFLSVPWSDFKIGFPLSFILFIATVAIGAIIILLSRKTD